MDMVAKIFNIFPVKKHNPHIREPNEDSRAISLIVDEGWAPPWLDSNNIRLVLFHEHDSSGKIPVFDTKQYYQNCPKKADAVSLTGKITDDSLSSSFNHLNTSKTSRAQSSDSQMLGEMMFGSMPLKLAGNSVKIHYIKSQQQLLLTKIFIAHHRPMPTCHVGNFSESCPVPVDNYHNDYSSSVGTTSDYGSSQLKMASLSPDSDIRCRSSSFNRSLLQPCPSPSASLPVSLGSSYNHDSYSPNQLLSVPVPTSSLNSSLTRRLHRARSTSLENATHLYHRVIKPIDQGTATIKKGKKFAVGLIFSLQDMCPKERRMFQDFFFSHFSLISSHLDRLREKIEEALSRRLQLSERIAESYNSFVNSFVALYSTQRIKAPVWLSVVRSGCSKKDVCRKFLVEFVSLASELDNKETKYFLSTVLTSVLSLHLAWMFTVTKNGYSSSRYDKIASKSLAVLPETHPYNPLWAQLGDLYGAVTDPLLVTRTIVTGSNVALVHRLLYILTYFIRCSEIEPNSLFELKKSLFEDSDNNHESRAASTVTVTEDPVNGSLRMSQSTDLPFIKPHPFSLNRHSVSSSLRSTESITDIPRVGSSNNDSCSVPSTSSLRFTSDLQKSHKDTQSGWNKSDTKRTVDYKVEDLSSNQAHMSLTGMEVESLPYCTTMPKCIRSIGSNDSWHSEPATDSGRFSDTELNQRCKDFVTSVAPPSQQSLPLYCNSSSHKTHNIVMKNDLQSCKYSPMLPGIKVTCNLDECDIITPNPSTAKSSQQQTTLSPSTCTPLNHCSSSPDMGTFKTLTSSPVSLRNKSWTGLPLIEGVFSESEIVEGPSPIMDHEDMESEDNPMTLKIDHVNVEESLSASSLHHMIRGGSNSPSASGTKGMKYAKEFQDFTSIDISRCSVAPKSESSEGHKGAHYQSLKSTPSDFGHSLMAGYSVNGYLNDFVLHGTSQPFSEFKDSLIMDLSNLIKNSIVDVPVQHAAAILIDSDSLTCKTLILSKSPRSQDGEVLTGHLPFSISVHEIIQSVSLLWKMQMGPEFCLSHLEDSLMELSDRSQMVSSAVLEKPESVELSMPFLHQIHSTLNIPSSDQKFLQALACVHCSNIDRDISSALQTSFIRSLVSNSK